MIADDDRAAARLDFARRASGRDDCRLQRAGSDAGTRSYWRIAGATPGRVVMDAPPATDDPAPWLAMRDLLESGGVRVPAVLERDVEAGFLLLEDLGSETFLQVLDAGNADELFDAAITQLLRLQAIVPPPELPLYDEVLLMRELALFDEWFLGRHLGLKLDCDDLDRLELGYRCLINAALAQPQVLVHRDFMLRNLMPVNGGPAVLDFQDAVRGPVAYDPLCLFKDAFVSWPEARVDGWLARYHARALEAGIPLPPLARFRRDADLIGVHRHLKVLGIFARLRHRDGKPGYLDDAPRFVAYLDAVLPRHPELASLHSLMRDAIKPALGRHEATQA
ncbi:MAG TPA: phosphotransferase [Rhodanobacteraceae bacterium]|nr:phosphotransferase [Rhodanobacteraceae bacterium]